MRRAAISAAAAAAMLFLPSQAGQPGRSVARHVLISRHDPAVDIRLPQAARYVGTDRFLLHDPKWGDFDNCELFAFVEADKDGAPRKLYWVQFEAYLPSHPELHHIYDSPRHATLGGLDFYLDTWVSSGAAKPEPGSDEEHFYTLLGAHGYTHRDVMMVRLVHLTDTTKRKELMIIYGEALPVGYSAAALKKGGAAYAQWPRIERGLIQRAEKSVSVKPAVQPSGGY